jgi:GTPase SAR1 family protein
MVGKSSLQKRLANNPLQIFESFSPRTQYNTLAHYQGENYYIYFGQEASERQKYFAKMCDVVLVCFSTEAFHTLKKAKQWIKTARSHKNNVIILVGLKADIRSDVLEQNDPEELVGLVSTQEGADVAMRYKCLGYVEVSSKTKEGFNELIEMIIHGKSLAFNQGKKHSLGRMLKLKKKSPKSIESSDNFV